MQNKYLLWDFDNTLAYRDGMWGQTIYDLLQEYGYRSIRLEDIRPLLTSGFPWHTPEMSHEEFFGGIQWWDYMTLHFSKIIHQLGINETLSSKIAGQIKINMNSLETKKPAIFADLKEFRRSPSRAFLEKVIFFLLERIFLIEVNFFLCSTQL
ncbi:hypothetical protein [Methanosarcina barkeri]|uniref:HAD superfamily hydrolase n=1 Tax=Methanosarcina barkeri CM1 TaxID=796385 RepID=A0A0G3C8E9_METBA|nr:hypothetical protein [Methanosarcina barkeri]AKJ38261.1 hypothetical protein MCM1_1205 [Methanosarcina barkeri CM1]